MSTRDRIAEKLDAAFAPVTLDVQDESHQHAGHAGSRPGGETHYRVSYRVGSLPGEEPDRAPPHGQRDTVEELAGGVHALAIHASAPGEGD